MDNRLKEIKDIFYQDKNEIIKKYSATGAGIGREENEYVIVVYMDKNINSGSNEKLFWKNIPIKLKYIGKIKTQMRFN